MNDLILEKTKELGEMLAQCEEHQELLLRTDAFENDETAQKLVADYNELRSAKMKELREKEMDAESVRAAREYIQNAFSGILENETVLRYIEANKRFEELMNQVNNVLNFCVTGEEESGCSGSCGTCGGCH